MARQLASHEDYVRLETLVESGLSVYQSAKQIGLPLGAFKSKSADRTWYERIKEKEETCRAAAVDELIDRRVQNGEAGDALTSRWAARNHEAYREKTQVEISGPDGGAIEIEGKVTGLEDVVAFAIRSGNADALGLELDAGVLRGALPAAEEVLPGRAGERQPAAGALPAAEEA